MTKQKKFALQATVERTVVDHIELTVSADTEQEAYQKAEACLRRFPDKNMTVQGIDYCYVTLREYPDDALVIDLAEQDDKGVA